MNKLLRKMYLLGIGIALCNNLLAQAVSETKEPFMVSNGKIYVVMAVVLTIVIGLFIYLINLDKKITKLEK